jgi:hypothetical protein
MTVHWLCVHLSSVYLSFVSRTVGMLHLLPDCRRTERFDWTEEDILDVVTSEGRAVDPNIVLNSPTFKTLNPYHMPDWAGLGIEYMDDIDEWIGEQGRWMEQENLPHAYQDDSEDESATPVCPCHSGFKPTPFQTADVAPSCGHVSMSTTRVCCSGPLGMVLHVTVLLVPPRMMHACHSGTACILVNPPERELLGTFIVLQDEMALDPFIDDMEGGDFGLEEEDGEVALNPSAQMGGASSEEVGGGSLQFGFGEQ